MTGPTDALDIRLLNALIADGRVTNRDLAKRLGLSESACLARRNKLERLGVIDSYSAVIAYERLTGVFRAFVSVKLAGETLAIASAFENIVRAEPEVVASYAVAREGDYMLEIMAPHFDAAQALVERLRAHVELVSDASIRPILKQSVRQARPHVRHGAEDI